MSTTACNVSGAKLNGNVVVLTEQQTENATYDIKPSLAQTVYIFSTPIKYNSTITFNVDNSLSQVGDQMIWSISNSKDDSILLANLTPPTFYFSACGQLENEYSIEPRSSQYGNTKYVQYWAFDGTSWIYSSDNY
jgi:hypothetical protein